ncbi:STAS domain-containing protein [Variovorax terrae]|uniref:STAS domain-containing protein n=1 Tax=Variovorax terrae TaxID=2923278 RepID=A0A9X1VRB8_9BURK|nr:STAS domain-containing protein [Variovorax terrae]MCJ0761965.1 STAS domain-containing protein [Variovorax terrae]
MAKDDNAGLLSKVVKFVRNPTTNWADLDQQETDRESNYSKQMLKEMIERKRRNDFVRKREFDMLRKMRRREAMAGQDPAARPSFFQSSMPSKPDDRAMTLKKIDEIEAQMSMQWWKTKHGDSSVRTPNYSTVSSISADAGEQSRSSTANSASAPPKMGSIGYAKTDPAPLLAARVKAASPATLPPHYENTVPPPARAPAAAPAPVQPVAPPPPSANRAGRSDPPPSGFSHSKLFAVEVDEAFAHDPELEEASIRFANGDDAGAEAGLLEALGAQGTRSGHDETWLTLFDLYRATGQHERFESAAIDFAGRFSRSAPQWFSIPEMVGRMAAPSPSPSASARPSDWVSPSTFGTQSLAALNAALGKSAQPWRLDWSKLVAIEAAAAEPLRKLFAGWGAQPVQLRFIGADRLDEVLKKATPSGDKAIQPEWWRLRMEVLRIMHRPDEFELAALDYCVTYEVSPPSWDSARCEYKPLDSDGGYLSGHTLIGESSHDSLAFGASDGDGDTQTGHSQLSHISSVELAGQIVGDASATLDRLEAKLAGADVMVISCAKLIRVDFSAAGTLLNWVTSRQAEGRQVQFSDVHRLVAAFFNVIGISEHSRVVTRTD